MIKDFTTYHQMKTFYSDKKTDEHVLFTDGELTIYIDDLNNIIFRFGKKDFGMTTGIAKILGTKYENNENIRSIKIIVKPFGRYLNNNSTKKSIAKIFLKYLEYNDSYIDSNYVNFSHKISLTNVTKKSDTIGEFIDNMNDLLYTLEIEMNAKKYNI